MAKIAQIVTLFHHISPLCVFYINYYIIVIPKNTIRPNEKISCILKVNLPKSICEIKNLNANNSFLDHDATVHGFIPQAPVVCYCYINYRVSNYRVDLLYALVCKGHACHILFSHIITKLRHETNCLSWFWVYKSNQK